MMKLVSAIRKRMSSESGVGLVELMVSLLLLTIVLGFVMQGFISMQGAYVQSTTRLENLDQARQLMDILTKDLRTATPLVAGQSPFKAPSSTVCSPCNGVAAGPTTLTFYANLNSATAPNLISIYVRSSDNALIEQTIAPDAGSVAPNYTYTGTPTVRLVGLYVANTVTQPLFIYYDAAGNALNDPSTGLTASDQLVVRSIGINLTVKKNMAEKIPGSTIVNEITLPNVYLSTDPSPSP